MKDNRSKFTLDLIMILGIITLMVPKLLGQTWHEWCGLVLAALVITHLTINWTWIKKCSSRFFGRLSWRLKILYLVNLLLLIGFTTIVVSGMFMAQSIDFSWLGISRSGGAWKVLHSSAAYLTFLLLGIHTGLNFDWIVRIFRSLIFPSGSRIKPPAGRRLTTASLLALLVLAGGIYSFWALDYASQANPLNVVGALQSLGQGDTGHAGNPAGAGLGAERQGAQGTLDGPGSGGRGAHGGTGDWVDALYFLGVFSGTSVLTHYLDRIRWRRQPKQHQSQLA